MPPERWCFFTKFFIQSEGYEPPRVVVSFTHFVRKKRPRPRYSVPRYTRILAFAQYALTAPAFADASVQVANAQIQQVPATRHLQTGGFATQRRKVFFLAEAFVENLDLK